MEIKIIGAGLTGLIAAHIFQQAEVWEANTADAMQDHKALLRFRSRAVEEVTGIPFREVTVRKGIWSGQEFIQPNIRVANAYSYKCTGKVMPRSIWDIAPCQRYIAPDDFVEQLRANVGARIKYGQKFSFFGRCQTITQLPKDFQTYNPVISTVPMSYAARQIIPSGTLPLFEHKSIRVYRYDLGNEHDVHQTVYFPYGDTNVYRASITGRTLIMEATKELKQADLCSVIVAFDLGFLQTATISEFQSTSQRYGKIAPVDNDWRRGFIHHLSDRLNVYSLGRFGTWRNILLDDVVHDCAVIKRLINSDYYTKGMVRAGA